MKVRKKDKLRLKLIRKLLRALYDRCLADPDDDTKLVCDLNLCLETIENIKESWEEV